MLGVLALPGGAGHVGGPRLVEVSGLGVGEDFVGLGDDRVFLPLLSLQLDQRIDVLLRRGGAAEIGCLAGGQRVQRRLRGFGGGRLARLVRTAAGAGVGRGGNALGVGRVTRS